MKQWFWGRMTIKILQIGEIVLQFGVSSLFGFRIGVHFMFACNYASLFFYYIQQGIFVN